MIPFQYFEFYDAPRYIVVRHRGRLILMQSAFDEEADEYPEAYSVYEIPGASEAQLDISKMVLLNIPMAYLGQIPIRDVRFDLTLRKELNTSCLDRLFDVIAHV